MKDKELKKQMRKIIKLKGTERNLKTTQEIKKGNATIGREFQKR